MDRTVRCARCGYDRSGLSMRYGIPRCPECGSRRIDLPWTGWRPVLLDATLPIVLLAPLAWGALILVGMFLNWELGRILHVALLGALGVKATLRPFEYARFYAVRDRGFPGRPGRHRILLVTILLNLTLVAVFCAWLPTVVPGFQYW